jgi:hypothetical protein
LKEEVKNMRSKTFSYIMVGLLAFIFLVSRNVRAAEDGEVNTPEMSGKVITFTDESITIVDESAEPDTALALPHSFIIDKKTTIDGNITEGAKVTITYIVEAADKTYIKRLALKIKVMESDKQGG